MTERKSKQYLYFENERPLFVSSHIVDGGGAYLEIGETAAAEISKRGHLYTVHGDTLWLKSELPKSLKRVAFISDYGVQCGIATYTEYLVNAMRPLVASIKVFAEENGDGDTDEVIRCWARNAQYQGIIDEVKKYNPDVIFLQHEYGLFHNHAQFNSLMSQLSKWKTVVTLHTVLEHDVPDQNASLDYMSRVLTEFACPEVIVHARRAGTTLRARGYSGMIHYVPHGCVSRTELAPLPATKYGMFTLHSIFQYGFGGRHKGWEMAIDVVDRLRSKYPDIFYLGAFSLSPQASSSDIQYHEELLDLVRKRGLEKHVALQRGFQSEQMLTNLARCSRVALYPYQRPNASWASWGASGAVQLPISLGMPIVLSDFPCFQEFEDLFPVCKTSLEMAWAIDRIFSDPGHEADLRANARALAEATSWKNTAIRYLYEVEK